MNGAPKTIKYSIKDITEQLQPKRRLIKRGTAATPKVFKTSLLMALFISFVTCGTANAARSITSLPFELNFDSDNYGDLVKIDEALGASHTWESNGGWNGGAAKFVPPNITEGYSGLGSFTNIGQNIGQPQQLNVRFLVYYGRTLGTLGPTRSKRVIMNVSPNISGLRPMALTDKRLLSDGSWENIKAACQSTECNLYPEFPRGIGQGLFQWGNDSNPNNYNEQWVSIELEANIPQRTVTLYMYTQDGSVSGVQAQYSNWGGGDFIDFIDGIGLYWGDSGENWPLSFDENTYFKIDELKIHTEYIGPPAGFLSNSPPVAPGSAIVR